MADTKRYRVMHKFWLDLRKDYEDWLDETIHTLKQERTYSQTVRDGIRLIVDLRHKKLDALLELFPWVENWIESEVQRRIAERSISIQSRIDRLEGQLDAMSRMQQPQLEAGSERRMLTDNGQRPMLPGPQKNADDEDDTALLTVKKARGDNGQSAENFLKSMMNLQAGFKQ